MIVFEIGAAIVALAAAPQGAGAHRPPAAVHKPVARKVDHVAACRRAHKGYDARTDSYRDARGKRQRCTL